MEIKHNVLRSGGISMDPEISVIPEGEDDGISELCDMLESQPLWCGEENVMILQCSFDVTRRMLERGSSVKPGDLARHVNEVKRRYRAMLRDLCDWLDSERLKPYAELAVATDNGLLCLMYAFYIDHELIRLCQLGSCDIIED
jgi:hypothetical protein